MSAGETAYWFIGAQVSANAANLFNATATLALGYGYPVSANPSNLIYTNLIPASYQSDGKVNGLHFSASTFMGIRDEDTGAMHRLARLQHVRLGLHRSRGLARQVVCQEGFRHRNVNRMGRLL